MDVVELVPKTDDLPYSKAVVWIDRQDGLVRRVEIEETSGQQRTLVLSQLAVNRGVPGREFTFSPPAGLRVVDQ
jgi:outer membrane lipoprotein-sorting protein